MHGNVWEWCWDWRSDNLLGGCEPVGPASTSSRVDRGGSWFNDGWLCRATFRGYGWPDDRNIGIGFRPVMAPGQ
jgi:formylglycine-generating enzyme required for sulfatase activity